MLIIPVVFNWSLFQVLKLIIVYNFYFCSESINPEKREKNLKFKSTDCNPRMWCELQFHLGPAKMMDRGKKTCCVKWRKIDQRAVVKVLLFAVNHVVAYLFFVASDYVHWSSYHFSLGQRDSSKQVKISDI